MPLAPSLNLPCTPHTKIAMSKYLLFFVLLFLDVLACYSQIPEGFPFITKADLPGVGFSVPRVFRGTSLFGYIDGGAELYLEYGFSSAVVGEISFLGGKYKTEVYKMTGPEEAFGIFSVSKYRCLSTPPVASFTCLTRYQLQVCKGPYYISIINGTGTESDSTAMLKLGKILTGRITGPDPDLSGYLPGVPAEAFRIGCFLAKGRLGIVNGSPDLEDFFSGISGYTAVVLNEDGKIRLSVKFKNDESISEFLKLHHWENVTLSESDQKLSTGETLRLISSDHLLITLQK
jgi:hypothetical protein